MALSGRVETISIAELLRFLGASRRTGVLAVQRADVHRAVVLAEGDVLYCSAGRPTERIGQRLTAAGVLDQRGLELLLSSRADDTRLGELAVARGLADAADVERVLREKVLDSLADTLSWTEGSFEFSERALTPVDAPYRLDLAPHDVDGLSARVAQDLASARAQLPDVRARVRPGRTARPESAELRALVAETERAPTIHDLCDARPGTPLRTLVHVARLVSTGCLDVGAFTEAPVDAKTEAPIRLATSRVEATRPATPAAPGAATADVERLRAGVAAAFGGPHGRPAASGAVRRGGASCLLDEGLLALLDGRRDVAALVELSGLSEADALSSLLRLFHGGLAVARVVCTEADLGVHEPAVVGGPGVARRPPGAFRPIARRGQPASVRKEFEPGPGGR